MEIKNSKFVNCELNSEVSWHKELTFKELADKNEERCILWNGEGSHESQLEFNTIELAGETGELCDAVKKYLRFKRGMVGGIEDLTPVKEELGDVVICCSLLATTLGIDLGEAVREKFNKTSEKYDFDVIL